MMRKVGVLLVLLFAVAAVGAWFLVDKREHLAWQGDASLDVVKGKFYGSGRFLEAYGHDDVHVLRMIEGLDRLTGRDNLLVVSGISGRDVEADARELLDWVERGNHLVLPVALVAGENHLQGAVLSRVGVEAQEVPPLRADGTKGEDGATGKISAYVPNVPACLAVDRRYREEVAPLGEVRPLNEGDTEIVLCSHELNRLSWSNRDGQEWLLRSPYPRVRFVPKEDAEVYFASRSPSGSQFVRVGLGEGSITLVTDTDWLGNPMLYGHSVGSNIKTYHHADLLAYLATGTKAVWLVETLKWRTESLPAPTWWKMFREQPVLTVLVLAALVVFVWRQAVRVGQVRILPPAPERYLNRHFLAQGQFLLRHIHKTAILRRLQRDLLEDLHRRHPAWGHLTLMQQLDWLCGQTRLPPGLVRPWLEPLPDLSAARWMELLQGHRRIVQALKRKRHG